MSTNIQNLPLNGPIGCIAMRPDDVAYPEHSLIEAIVLELHQYGVLVKLEDKDLIEDWIDKGLSVKEASEAARCSVVATRECLAISFKYVHKVIDTNRKKKESGVQRSAGDVQKYDFKYWP